MNAWNIIGHDWAVRRLGQQIESGQLAQSHLFVGPPSVGKAALAQAMASHMLSLHAADPVRAQRLVDQQKHPDVSWVGVGDGESSIKIEQVRQLIHTLTLSPVEGRNRLAVLDDMHLATEESQNAILKTLEEPSPSSVIVLITPSTDGVLPTIMSRCQVLNLRPVAQQKLAEGLVQRGVMRERAEFLARLSRGRPGWAIRAHENSEILDQRAQRLTDLEMLLNSNRTRRFQYAKSLSETENEARESTLEEWLLYWRDVVRASSGGAPAETLHNIDHFEAIMQLADQVSTRQATGMVRAITNALKFLQQNAKPQLVFDALMLQMPIV
ncbi:MAG TPA: AAA family ATPase [Anaerolineae bacterium]